MWQTNLNLTFNDKHDIVSDKWLTSNHMYAANRILRKQYVQIGSLQNTEHAPIYDAQTNNWLSALPFKSASGKKIAQIHHTGQSHWVVSVNDNNAAHEVHVFDSLNGHLTTSLQIQIAQIYRSRFKNSNHIPIKLPKVQRQTNGNDCGVFAIAFLVEFCENGLKSVMKANFKIDQMRSHLISCFEKESLTPFPKYKNLSSNPSIVDTQIGLSCVCRMPDSMQDMVGCENENCENAWYHLSCAFGTEVKSTSLLDATTSPWYCRNCLILSL
jgi:hypothetical protein